MILTYIGRIARAECIALGIRDFVPRRRRGVTAEAFCALDGGDGVSLAQAGRHAGALALEGVCAVAGEGSGAAEAAQDLLAGDEGDRDAQEEEREEDHAVCTVLYGIYKQMLAAIATSGKQVIYSWTG